MYFDSRKCILVNAFILDIAEIGVYAIFVCFIIAVLFACLYFKIKYMIVTKLQ